MTEPKGSHSLGKRRHGGIDVMTVPTKEQVIIWSCETVLNKPN
jgi:hypothetical protein